MELHTLQSLHEIHGIDLRDRTREVRFLTSAKKLLLRLIRRIADAHESRMAESALMRLTDQQLRDIGISRGEIRAKVRSRQPT
jgi:uncharacterized protein YjiS (DUF1127 family)